MMVCGEKEKFTEIWLMADYCTWLEMRAWKRSPETMTIMVKMTTYEEENQRGGILNTPHLPSPITQLHIHIFNEHNL